jgi:hypothetical protein
MPSANGHSPKPERVGLYMRVSSEEQRDRETIEIQREFLEQFRSLYELEVAEIYEDDGISGTIPLHERPEGRRLLEDAKEGKFQTVLVKKLDRLGRTLLVIVDAHDRLQEAGVALRSATEPIDTSLSFRVLFRYGYWMTPTGSEDGFGSSASRWLGWNRPSTPMETLTAHRDRRRVAT